MTEMTRSTGDLSPLKRAMLAIQRLEAKVERLESEKYEPIAIVGMGCRFPVAGRGPQRFWRFLRDGGDAISEIPTERWATDEYYDPDPERAGRMYSKYGGFISDLGAFEYRLFGVSPREAERMDPQQQLLLECSWSALEDAGFSPKEMTGTRAGVYFGLCSDEYSQSFAVRDGLEEIDAYTFTGATFSIAAGRVSYLLGLTGPAMVVDTACSSSLVCVHLACQALRARECDMALAGGATAILSPVGMICMSRLRALSPDGRCKTFDAAADGYARGEGCGVVVLRRLSDALRDGDDIVAVIRGSAVDQDGKSLGLTAPSQRAQVEVIKQALIQARVRAEQVEFVETHGTGTALGDPIEVESLAAVYGREGKTTCRLGAVKSNLGHTEGAAGAAGIIKLAMCLRNGHTPRNLHFRKLNPRIELSGTRIQVAAEDAGWERQDGSSRIGAVSGFGISGTNCHVILQEAPPVPANSEERTREPGFVFPLSCADMSQVGEQALEWRAWIEERPDLTLTQIASTAACREPAKERLALPFETREELLTGLAELASGEPSSAWLRSSKRLDDCVFVFAGQGGQWPGMGKELYEANEAFRSAMERCAAAIRSFAGWDPLEEMLTADETTHWSIDRVQPLLFAYQVSLAEAWMSIGVRPRAVLGHSVGEVAASYIAGVLDLEAAVRVIVCRSRRLAELPQNGAMALVELAEDAVRRTLGDKLCGTEIAVVSDRKAVVLAGKDEAVEGVLERLNALGVFARRVDVTIASHCSFVEPALPKLRQDLRGLAPSAGQISVISSVRGGQVDGTELGVDYWVEQLSHPVHFAQAVESLLSGETALAFVEIAPHASVAHSVQNLLQTAACSGKVISPLRRTQSERQAWLRGIGELWTVGIDLEPSSWSGKTASGAPARAWGGLLRELSFRSPTAAAVGRGRTERLGPGVPDADRYGVIRYSLTVGTEKWPWLEEHVVGGKVIWPAAASIAVCVAAAQRRLGLQQVELRNVVFLKPLQVPATAGVHVQLLTEHRNNDPAGRIRMFAVQEDGEALEIVRAEFAPATSDRPKLEIPADVGLGASEQPDHEFYQAMARRGLSFGKSFQGVSAVVPVGGRVFAAISRNVEKNHPEPALPIHPALLDACFQCAAALPGTPEGLWVPASIASFRWFGVGARPDFLTARAAIEDEAQPGQRSVSMTAVADEDVVCDVKQLSFASQQAVAEAPLLDEWVLKPHWVECPTKAGDLAVPGIDDAFFLFGANEPLLAALQRELPGADGAGSLAELRRKLEQPAGMTLRGVVYVARDRSSGPSPGLDDVRDGALDYAQVLELVWTLVEAGTRTLPRLWIVTQGLVRATARDAVVGLGQSLLWGLAATIAHEIPELRTSCVDLGGANLRNVHSGNRADVSALDLSSCARILANDLEESQFALREGTVYVPRLRRWSQSSAPMKCQAKPGAVYSLEQSQIGSLDAVDLKLKPATPLGAHQVRIQVRSAALNFRDVLLSLGLVPDSSAGSGGGLALGGECAGVVTAVGANVSGFACGDEVVALAEGALASSCTADHRRVFRKPARMSWDEAAGFLIASMTAWEALINKAQLRSGESVLIHSAAGGVGLAAVQIAKRVGAPIFATAGTAEKRQWLRERWDVERVYDSRSDEFREQIQRDTAGRGVDVVLNSLAGHFIEAGLDCLAHYGRFVEIGKRDYVEGRGISLRAMLKGIEYYFVDLLMLAERRPDRFRELAEEAWKAFDDYTLSPQIGHVYGVHEVHEAFAAMAKGVHRGKLCVDFTGDARLEAAPQAGAPGRLRQDATYIITGGMGAIGRLTAEWMVERGAGQVLLLGRRDRDAIIDAELGRLGSSGCDVRYFPVDLAEPDRVRCFFETYRSSEKSRPIAGIVHSAVVLEDATVLEQDLDALGRVLGAKAHAAAALHLHTLADPLEFFVLYSSAASVFGSPGQANYAAANAYLDALAHHRRSLGMPAISVNWGPWAEVGQAALADNRGLRMEGRGMALLTPKEGWALFDQIFLGDTPSRRRCSAESQVVVAKVNLRQWRQFYPRASELGLLSELDSGSAAAPGYRQGEGSELLQTLREVGSSRRVDVMQAWLREQLAAILRLHLSDVGVRTPFKSLGVDSLMSLEVRNRIEAALGLRLSATVLWTWPNVEQLANHLLEACLNEAAKEPAEPRRKDDMAREVEALAPEDVDVLAAMTDDELEALLGD